MFHIFAIRFDEIGNPEKINKILKNKQGPEYIR